MVREVASKTNDLAGDGTTIATKPPPRSAKRPCGRRRHEPDGFEARHRHRGDGGRRQHEKRAKKVVSSDEIADVPIARTATRRSARDADA